MIYIKAYPGVPQGKEPRSRIIIVDDEGTIPCEIDCVSAAVADVAANACIAELNRRNAVSERIRMHTIGDEVVEIGAGSGEGE